MQNTSMRGREKRGQGTPYLLASFRGKLSSTM